MKEVVNTSSTPFFSIIIPVYNVKRYISECVNSILFQSFPDFEIILVNDGSTDGSGEICDKYASTNQHIKVIHKSNFGTASARNAGMKVAQGKYLWFIDSDDLITNNSLFILFDLLLLNKDIAVLNFTKKDFKEGDLPDLTLEKALFPKMVVKDNYNSISQMPSSVCFSLYLKKIIFDSALEFNINNQFEDEYFNLQLYTNHNFKILFTEFPFYLYRRRVEGNKTNMNSSESLYEKCNSKIELFLFAKSIKLYGFNECFLDYKKRIYSEYALFFFELYLRSDFPKHEGKLLKNIRKNVKYIPIKGKLFKSSHINKLLYNLNVDLFVIYVRFSFFLKKNNKA